MKVGLIARSEDRGLGVQTWEAYRHLQPDRTLLVDMGPLGGSFAQHPERFPDATTVEFDGHRLADVARDWMDGLDVVLSCETLYDWRLAEWGRELGCATVVQVNPEFYRHSREPLPHPTVWWNPSSWLHDTLPPSARHVPVPVALDRWPDWSERELPLRHPDRLRVLHVAGKRAAGDRNGTQVLAMALRRVHEPMKVTVATQERRMIQFPRRNHQRIDVRLGGIADYWELYEDHDVLVMPRRYGGLCLPVQEAMAAGLAIVMTGCSPNADWPAQLIPYVERGHLTTPAGDVPLCNADERQLAWLLDQLATTPDMLADLKGASMVWAIAHSWANLLPLYQSELAHAADRAALPAVSP